MRQDAADTSSISFTALYTGHVWYAHGMSAEAFHNLRGSFLYHALAPFEYVGEKLTGGNIKIFLLQRHHLIDHLLERAIEQDGVTQVLEIACGLSPRGSRFSERYPQLHYVEGDLPGMATRKHRLLADQSLLSHRHQVVPLNIFSREGDESLEKVLADHFDTAKPILVITEGLVNYFSLESIDPFWQRLQRSLRRFPRGTYLTDNYPLYHDHPLHRTMRVLGGLLGTVSRSQVSFHFGSDQEAEQHLKSVGFDQVTVHNPANYYDRLPIPRTRGTPFVRIIEANVKK